MRARVRRKRKKHHHRFKNNFSQRIIRFVLKYWTLLIFLPAAGLLIFEASKIGRKPSLDDAKVSEQVVEVRKPSFQVDLNNNKSGGNLNRLDPVTHIVGGVRERK
jgi:hypothetical protein